MRFNSKMHHQYSSRITESSLYSLACLLTHESGTCSNILERKSTPAYVDRFSVRDVWVIWLSPFVLRLSSSDGRYSPRAFTTSSKEAFPADRSTIRQSSAMAETRRFVPATVCFTSSSRSEAIHVRTNRTVESIILGF